jgi:hypothetical protein
MSRYPAPAPIHNFVLLFLPLCCLHLIPFDHRVHRVETTCLSTPRRPRKAKTFHARSSPAPTQIKPQPAPAIVGQESVHTMLSITHHTRERPSPVLRRSSPQGLLAKMFLLVSSRLSDRPMLPLTLGVGSSGAEEFVFVRLCFVLT